MSIEQRITDFKSAITPDLYNPKTYIDWGTIEATMSQYRHAINHLQDLVASCSLNSQTCANSIETIPYFYEVITTVLSVQRGVGFSNGNEVPVPSERRRVPAVNIAETLDEIGMLNMFQQGTDVASAVRASLVAQDALKRRYRVGATIKERLRAILHQIVSSGENTDFSVELLHESKWPQDAKGRVDFLLRVNETYLVAITSVFQSASGGRQLRDLSTTYPYLQIKLGESGVSLILIADGRGVREAQAKTLRSLFNGVASCMTLKEAANGLLLSEVQRLSMPESQSLQVRSVNTLIKTALDSTGMVRASDLPVDYDRARLLLASFAEEQKSLDLRLSDFSSMLSWAKRDEVVETTFVSQAFDPSRAIDGFCHLINVNVEKKWLESDVWYAVVAQGDDKDAVLPRTFLVASTLGQPTATTYRGVSSKALHHTVDSRLCFLVTNSKISDSELLALRKIQAVLTSNVIVIDAEAIKQIPRLKKPSRDQVKELILKQSDLIKTSPYILNSVAPENMFFGRDTEEAFMISALATNSVALLGGRRIGKTSLLRHMNRSLDSAGYHVFYGDCQTVREWDDFAKLAKRVWGVEVPLPFSPLHLLDLVKTLKGSNEGSIVFLLDEIDQLLDWDKHHSDNEVPEGFFRACRAISQEAIAQFVFTGERTIARKLWDPQSPHWNFCQPMMLRQLDESAARQLIMSPLKGLQIVITREEEFRQLAWKRTSGHPQLLQSLGDRLMRLLNERQPDARSSVSPDDLVLIADNYSYAEQYLETYWGQATKIERLLSLLVASGLETTAKLQQQLREYGLPISSDEIRPALRMLDLYGFLLPSDAGYTLKLEWFFEAISFYGGLDTVISTSIAEWR